MKSTCKGTPLGAILNDDQLEAVLTIIQTWHDEPLTRIRKLKEYLAQFRTELENKGVVPEYLAYVINQKIQLIHLNTDSNPLN